MPTSAVKDVAKVVLQKSASPVSNLKLQKLLYYVQGWSLAVYGEPAFVGRIEAWVHGPVVPEIFYAYRRFRWSDIDTPVDSVNLSSDEVGHIETVLSIHGNYTATQLEDASHKESPWIEARKGLSPKEPSNAEITNESMKAYFTALLNA